MAVLLKRTFDLARMAGNAWKLRRSKDKLVAEHARRALVERLGRLRGLPSKLGQLLSMSSSEESRDFLPLTNQVAPLPFSTIRDCLMQAWGKPIARVVSRICDPGIAASLGQVHRATLLDGTDVAIKVRYPNIQEAVASDLSLFGWMTFPGSGPARGFDMVSYQEEILRNIAEELDYEIEADHQRIFAQRAQEIPGLVVPRVIDKWSSESVLVTTWEEGESIEGVLAHWSTDARSSLARQLFHTFCKLLFDDNIIHADPHAGNYRFRQRDNHHEIVMYDFGSILTLTERERLALIGLIRATMDRQPVDPFPFFVALGFNETLLEPLRGKLPALCSVLFEPFVSDCPYDWSTWNRGNRVSGILGEDRWNFRISGPARLIFLLRIFHGLIYYLRKPRTASQWSSDTSSHPRKT